MQTLERLFSTTQKERMLAAIPQRVSCRAFSAVPSPADWAALAYAASRYTLPGARLILMNCPEELFTGTLLNMGRVTGCRAVAVVAASSTVESSRIYAGITGEALTLEAVSMGLGACWISRPWRIMRRSWPLSPWGFRSTRRPCRCSAGGNPWRSCARVNCPCGPQNCVRWRPACGRRPPP